MASASANGARLMVFPRVWPRSLCRSPELARHLSSSDYHCYHVHSLWLQPLGYARSAAARRGVPLVISPRGMMSEWAWRHRRGRKWLAEKIIHPGAFAAASGWHATSKEEAEDIRRLGFRQPICVSPNGVDVPNEAALAAARSHWSEAFPQLRGRRIALFYSRFHRKKRILELIDLWRSRPADDWFLLLVGLADEHTASELNGRLAAANMVDRALAVDGAGRPPPYAFAEILLLPSHSENFGLVVAEALASGAPALVTDQTPWSELEARGAGWQRPWSDWTQALSHALAESPESLRSRGRAGRTWMQAEFTWKNAAETLLRFYASLR